jgi:hypothetical protein
MRLADFIFLPDYQVFEVGFLARNNSEWDNSCLKIFSKGWIYYNDVRDKIILISQELDKKLLENHYKSQKNKRQALFKIVSVYDEPLGCDYSVSQVKLASILAIEENRKVFFITDNQQLQEMLSKFGLFKVISSEKAEEMLDQLEK